MFQQRTLFVVGAGASYEAGLPLGVDLKAEIAKKVNIICKNGNEQSSGDYAITKALREHVRNIEQGHGDIKPYLRAGRHVAAAMPMALSIDNFLDAHQDNEYIQICGKLGITRCILQAERQSKLYFNASVNNELNFLDLSDTWYHRFLQFLTEDVSLCDVAQIFWNVSFIIFNYDRCIEHFLFNALKRYYLISDEESAVLMNELQILHPYGVVGRLPWQARGQSEIAFGGSNDENSLLALAGQLKTFTEQTHDNLALFDLRGTVAAAETIVFLGFAYHKQNMRLIKLDSMSTVKRIFGTAKGISGSDCENVINRARELVGDNLSSHPKISNGLTCSGLFN